MEDGIKRNERGGRLRREVEMKKTIDEEGEAKREGVGLGKGVKRGWRRLGNMQLLLARMGCGEGLLDIQKEIEGLDQRK